MVASGEIADALSVLALQALALERIRSRPSVTGVPWSRFEAEAPELAAAVQARFAAHIHHIIGTLRPDGSPRLSGTRSRSRMAVFASA